MSKILSRIWHDPVWSAVIAGLILLLIVSLGAVVREWWPHLFRYQIPVWVVLLATAVVGLLGWWIWPRSRTIEIVSMRSGDKVEFQQDIHGITSDPTLPIEVLVFAGGAWHTQWAVEVDGKHWHGKCQFGSSAESSAGKQFRVVAIAPKTPFVSKSPNLPADAVKSDIVNVTRST